MKPLALLLSICLAFAGSAEAQDYLGVVVLGQSNMVGGNSGPRELFPGGADDLGDRVYCLDRSNRITPWHYPFPFALDGPESGNSVNVSPAVSFVRALSDRYPQHKIVVVFCGRVSSSFNGFLGNPEMNWAAPGSVHKLPNNLYDRALNRVRKADELGVQFVAGLIQLGESDSNVFTAPQFAAETRRLIDGMRSEAGPIAFALGTMPQWEGSPFAGLPEIDAGLQIVSTTVPGAFLASAEGLTPDEDMAHFDTASSRILGQRMFDALQSAGAFPPMPGLDVRPAPYQPHGPGNPFSGPSEVVLHQSFENGVWFESYSELMLGAELGPDQVSRLHEFERFRRADGSFELSAQWGEGVTVRWRQTSNPFLVPHDQVHGFEILVDPLDFVGQGLFDGLCRTRATGAILGFRKNGTDLAAPACGFYLFSEFKLAQSIGFPWVVYTPHSLLATSITLTAH